MSDAAATAPLESTDAGEAQTLAAAFRADYAAVRAQVTRVIVGQDAIVDGVLTALFCNGHCLLEGVPGLGKTLLIRTLSRALSLSFSRVQFTPDLMPADILGTTIVAESAAANGERARQFVFQRGPIFAQMVLADEINRATPKTQSALLEAMAERSVTIGGVGGKTYHLDRPFFVMATQNPLEQEGTYPLPEAQLDRFFFKLLVETSSRRELFEILSRTTAGREAEVEPVLSVEKIIAHQRTVTRVALAAHVQDYAVRVVLATHPGNEFATPLVQRFVKFGASPRAAQALVLGAKCVALLDSRFSASMADVQRVALAALRHRLILNFEAHAEGMSADAVVRNVLDTLPQGVDLGVPLGAAG
ncbi:MoxR family ATPase [soil metagenome]